jgi:hypothetical protein
MLVQYCACCCCCAAAISRYPWPSQPYPTWVSTGCSSRSEALALMTKFDDTSKHQAISFEPWQAWRRLSRGRELLMKEQLSGLASARLRAHLANSRQAPFPPYVSHKISEAALYMEQGSFVGGTAAGLARESPPRAPGQKTASPVQHLESNNVMPICAVCGMRSGEGGASSEAACCPAPPVTACCRTPAC